MHGGLVSTINVVEPGPTGGPGAMGALIMIAALRREGHTVNHCKLGKSPTLDLFSGQREEPDAWFVSCLYVRQFRGLRLLFERMGVPLWRRQRTERDALVVFGGQAMATPAPIQPFADIVALGDGELTATRIAALLDSSSKPAIVEAVSGRPGFWTPLSPSLVAAYTRLEPVVVRPGTRGNPTAEVARGCRSKCLYCTIGWAGGPYREAKPADIRSIVRAHRGRSLSLFAPDFGGVSYVEDVTEWLSEFRCNQTARDTRLDALVGLPEQHTDSMRSVQFGLDAPSYRLRRAVGKHIPGAMVLDAYRRFERTGLRHTRLMMIVGYPGETEDDRDEFGELLEQIAEVYTGMVDITMSLLDPAPHTPLQYADAHHKGDAYAWSRALYRKASASWDHRQWLISRSKGAENYEHEMYLRRADEGAAEYLAGAANSRSWVEAGRWRTSAGPLRLDAFEPGTETAWDHVRVGPGSASTASAWAAYRRRVGVGVSRARGTARECEP